MTMSNKNNSNKTIGIQKEGKDKELKVDLVSFTISP